MPARGLQRRIFAKEDYLGCVLLSPQSGVEKVIVSMVNNDHGMRDTVVRVSGSWETKSEDELGVVPAPRTQTPTLMGGFAYH